ncbi:uncharacterized protein LOC122659589 [Telopea speciosissima]|uniref:uncharacterized protein LOC122659589 n=1 Tax=Telopea speciosissima TaxID=54955 RepID=UPI001CC77243|nr:uncharacterized protein LOC122659589 [Telopea speciosissima]
MIKRQLRVDPSYKPCGNEVESTDRIILGCSFARAVWFGSNLSYVMPNSNNPKLSQLLGFWSQLQFPNKKSRMAALYLLSFIVWHLWLARNELAFRDMRYTPEEIIERSQKAFQEFWASCTAPSSAHSNSSNQPVHWTVPPPNRYKLNCDASLPHSASRGGIGGILRNSMARPVMAFSAPEHFLDPFVGEALAVRTGLKATLDGGFENINIEVDNVSLASLLIDESLPVPMSAANIIDDIKILLQNFPFVNISWIPREANDVANSLARKATSLVGRMDWPNSNPWLLDLCQQDALCNACPPLQ